MADSVQIEELGEITVVARTQRADATKTVYVPTGKQKSSSTNGISLLSRVGIPQLSVNPVAESVKTVDNQTVSLYINYHPATAEDIKGLNPGDVKRVEYHDYPVDPRFQLCQHAVNFITFTYAYGGYTKISGKEQFYIHAGDAALYSKFAYKEMEYDLVIGGDYNHNPHIGTISDETYRLANRTVTRESTIESSGHKQRGANSAVRIAWDKSENFTFSNLVSYRRTATPEHQICGDVTFSDFHTSTAYHIDSPSRNSALNWNSQIYTAPGKGWTIDGNIEADLSLNSTTTDYVTSADRIENSADEWTWWLRGTGQANRAISEHTTLYSSISSSGGRTGIAYTGTSCTRNIFRQTFTGITIGLSLHLDKIAGSIDVGYAFESNYINGKTMADHYPFTHINLRYVPNPKNSFGIWFQYASFSPDATMKNPNIIQQSELMYVSGNPDLSCSRNIVGNISYTWLPGNMWQLSAYATMFVVAHRQTAVYTTEGPHGTMLKRYRNDGDYHHGQIGASVTAKFMDGKLAIHAAPRLLAYNTTGTNSVSQFPLTVSLSADYYLRHIFFNVYYDSAWSYLDGDTAFLRKMPMTLSVSAGYAWRRWNIQLSVVNPFRSTWQTSCDTFTSRWYDNKMVQYGSQYHRNITLSATYTFNYGKKIDQSAELTVDRSISTAILR